MLTEDEFFDEDERTEKIANEVAHLFLNMDIVGSAKYQEISYAVNATLKILEKGG